MTKMRAKVFRDADGNRMLFPAYIYSDKADEPLETWWFCKGIAIRNATGLKMERDWLEFDSKHFPHVETRIGSRGFAHGSETVLLFDGPEFSKVAA